MHVFVNWSLLQLCGCLSQALLCEQEDHDYEDDEDEDDEDGECSDAEPADMQHNAGELFQLRLENVEGPYIYIPPLIRKPEQQQFTM